MTVPGERGDRVDLPAHPGQVRQAKVPGRMRGEPLDPRGQGDPADHLRPGPQAQRLGTVATRLRQEQRPPCPADRGPVREVLRQQHPGRGRVRHDALQPVLRRLRPDPKRAVRRVNVVGAQRAQLLAPQRGIVGQRQHQAVARRLTAGLLQQPQPLLLARDPRQPGQPRHQAALRSARPAAGGVTAPAHRVGLAQPLLHQEVVEQPDRHQPLLDRRVRQPCPRVDRHHVRAPQARPRRQLPHEDGDMGTVRGNRVDALPLAQQQVLAQPAGIRIDRPRAPAPDRSRSAATSPPARAGRTPATSPSAPPCRSSRLPSPWLHRGNIITPADST